MENKDFRNYIVELREKPETVAIVLTQKNKKEFRGLLLKKHINFMGETIYEIYRIYNLPCGYAMYPLIPTSFFTEDENEALKWFSKYTFEMFGINYVL